MFLSNLFMCMFAQVLVCVVCVTLMNSRNAHSKPLLMWPVSMHCMAFFLVVPCSSSVDFSTNSHSPKIEKIK